MKKRLIYIDNQWFTISAPPPLKQVHPISQFKGEVHALLSFDYQGVIYLKTVKVHPPLSTLVKKRQFDEIAETACKANKLIA